MNKQRGVTMKPITDFISSCATRSDAAKGLGIHSNQLTRWVDSGALVDDKGHVWIRTSYKPVRIWPDDERIDNIGVNGGDGEHYGN